MAEARAYCAVLGCATVYFAMGLYFSFGSVAVYLISYLRAHSQSHASHEQSIWFFAAVGLSALLLPVGGLLHRLIGLRAAVTLAGLAQT